MPRRVLSSVLLASSVLALSLVTAAASPAVAQSRNPGAPGGDGVSASTFRAEYYAEVVPRLNEVMQRWGRAWSSDDVETLEELYSEDAILLPVEGAPVVGRDAVAAHFAAVLPSAGSMEAFMQAFDGSGGMAFVYGTFLAGATGGTERVTGELVTVFARRGRDWLIRAQTFRPASR